MLCRESELIKERSAFVDIFPNIKDFASFYSSLTTVFGQLVDSEDGAFFAGTSGILYLWAGGKGLAVNKKR